MTLETVPFKLVLNDPALFKSSNFPLIQKYTVVMQYNKIIYKFSQG